MVPIISVIIPCYNYGKYIKDAIESVEKCKEDIYEIIIVNDGSTDNLTIQVLKDYENKGYHVINQENKGLATARNVGIAASKGIYILPLDADNMIKTDYMLTALKIFKSEPETAVVYSEAEYFGEKEGQTNITKVPLRKLLLYNFIDACAVYKKECWEKFGGYDKDMPIMGFEDWDFWIRLYVNKQKFKPIHKALYYYRVRTGSMISNTTIPENAFLLKAYIIKKYSNEYALYIDELATQVNNFDYDKKRPFRSFFKYIYLTFNKNG